MKNFVKKLKRFWRRVESFALMHFYGNPSKKLKIVGVTGTNGKTTTATLLYKVATSLGYKAGLIGTVENLINRKSLGANDVGPGTTPDSMTLTKLFKKMVDSECEYVFMEVSSHALDQKRVSGINFVGGIFTNLTHDHLDYHKTFQNYFESKKKFFDMLPESAFALANADDDHGKKMLESTRARRFLYEFSNVEGPATLDDQFVGKILKLDFSGLELKFGGTIVKSKLLGKFNAYNLLAVWSASKLLGFDMEKVKKILETIEPPPGRFQCLTSSSGVLAIVDYAHTPDALENVLKTIQTSFVGKKIISVFGCGGDRDPIKRPKMGKIGAANSDAAIFTSDNPRSEDPERIISEMLPNLHSDELKKVTIIANRRKAIKYAVKIAQKGDIILCAGKGHEDYQEIKGVKTHFDDTEELKKAFN